jgi:hypothetical protein
MIHLMKLSVGSDSVEDHESWQISQRPHWPAGCAIHVTRMWPKRETEVLEGGSLYWVIKGQVLCRQRVLDLKEIDLGDGIPRCALILDAAITRTEPAPRRPFQGWRYLDPKDAPRDLPQARPKDDALPAALARALAELGLH